MSKAARSVYLFSIYLIAMGSVITIAPNFLLGVLKLPTADEVWIRIAGMLAFILGYYYFKAARKELILFIRWTVYGRLAGFLMFCILGIGGLGPPVLVLFGVVDGAAALWTHLCLKLTEDSGSCVSRGSK